MEMDRVIPNSKIEPRKTIDSSDALSKKFLIKQVKRQNYNFIAKCIIAFVTFMFTLMYSMKVVSAAQPTEEEIAAAQGMEAIFVSQMIEEMRKSIPENELMPTSHAEKIYRSMLDQEYSNIISRSNQFGIADQVLAEIKGER